MPFSRRPSEREIAQYAAAAQVTIEQKNLLKRELDRLNEEKRVILDEEKQQTS